MLKSLGFYTFIRADTQSYELPNQIQQISRIQTALQLVLQVYTYDWVNVGFIHLQQKWSFLDLIFIIIRIIVAYFLHNTLE